MQLALDPYMLRHLSLPEIFRLAAELGYGHIELSFRPDFLPLFVAQTATQEIVRELKAATRETGVRLASMMAVYRWSDTDEEERRRAVACWKRAVEIAVEAECPAINTEFSGLPEQPAACQTAFRASIDELLPLLEREDIRVDIEPHPGDFVEGNNEAVDIVRSINSPNLRYLYCAPHTFHMGDDAGAMIRYAAPLLAHVHVADSMNFKAGLRYIVNPLGSPVRIHQHLNIGEGEVDWDVFFGTLAEVGFDGIMTNCVLAWEDRAVESSRLMLERMQSYLSKYASAKRQPVQPPSMT